MLPWRSRRPQDLVHFPLDEVEGAVPSHREGVTGRDGLCVLL